MCACALLVHVQRLCWQQLAGRSSPLQVLGGLFYRYEAGTGLSSLAQACYFTLVTCTTIGYGDISPPEVAGQVFLVPYAMVWKTEPQPLTDCH